MTSCGTEEQHKSGVTTCSCQETSMAKTVSDFPIIGNKSTVCCGGESQPAQLSYERTGYRLWPFVESFMDTPMGSIPRVSTRLGRTDRWGTWGARVGIRRNDYRIAPGLYGVGQPDARSPVLVSANYKLSFDVLRSNLTGIDAWILVVETHGINVWCAAGKGSFCAAEVAERANGVGLATIVSHRRLILPQLSANGVSARQVRKLCGFEVLWGPVRAADIPAFLAADMQATPDMRRVTFTLTERIELIPVELNHLGKPSVYILPLIFLLSGFGGGFYSIDAAVARGTLAMLAYILAIAVGAVMAPILLPWLPGKAFAWKGAGIGAAAGALLSAGFVGRLNQIEMAALTLFIMAVSSYLAMNFTGSTPFTSPTGVEKEMRSAIPAQALGVLSATILWVGAGFWA